MAWVIPILVISIAALIYIVIAMLAGQIVGPLYDIVIDDPAVQRVGFDVGVEVAVRIGLKYVLPLLALALVIWFLVLRLMNDSYRGYRR